MIAHWTVTWTTGDRRGDTAVERAIAAHDLASIARHTRCQAVDGMRFTGFGSVRGKPGDDRIIRLVADLKRARIDLSERVDRRAGGREIGAADWLIFDGGKVIEAGANCKDQRWDRVGACRVCGAGAVQLPPLIAKLGQAGTAVVARGAHDGVLIVKAGLAAELHRIGATGFVDEPVFSPKSKHPDPRYRWIRITSSWPRAARSSGIRRAEPCPACVRAGHFPGTDGRCMLRYRGVPRGACDFNASFEYFGSWQCSGPLAIGPPVGGCPLTIVSSRVARRLREAGVPAGGFEPIEFS